MILFHSATSVENLVITIPTVPTMHVIYCLFNVMNVKLRWKTVVLTECLDITHLPLEEQVKLRSGLQVGNKVFRKGKSEALKFKKSGDLPDKPFGKSNNKKCSPENNRQKNIDRESRALLYKIKDCTVFT